VQGELGPLVELSSVDWEQTYNEAYTFYKENPEKVVEEEQEVARVLMEVALSEAPKIERDWNHAADTRPCWIERAPKQRGKDPSGDGVPWIEVAEYVPLTHLKIGLVSRYGSELSFPGLPTGGDLRVAFGSKVLHLDAKAAGPNDRSDEVVVPPYQISGDGLLTRDGVLAPEPTVENSVLRYPGRQKPGAFSPSLPPIYLYPDGEVRLCISAFLKVCYRVEEPGVQPLEHMTLAVVPNGILLHHQDLLNTPQLFARGKDDSSKPPEDVRCRIMFDPLAGIAEWRVRTIEKNDEGSWHEVAWSPT
jgi:hypothetical protein